MNIRDLKYVVAVADHCHFGRAAVACHVGQPTLSAQIRKLESNRPGMGVRTASDLGESGEAGVRYLLRWETLPSNRDRPRPGEPPPPSMLRLYKLVAD